MKLDWSAYRHLALAVLVGAGYWALASYSLALPVRSSGISYIWPADGLALGALLCTRPRNWPWYLAAVFLGNFLASNKPLPLNLLYSSFNFLEPLLVAMVVTRVLGTRPRIDSLISAGRLILLTASVMALAILVTTAIDWSIHRGDFWRIWSIWYISNTLGMLIIAPLILAFSSELADGSRLGPAGWLEAAVLTTGLFVGTHLIFSVAPGQPGVWRNLAATPMLVPALFLMWAAIRLAIPGATLGVAIVGLQSFWYTANGVGPYASLNPELHAALFHLQVSLTVIAVLAIVISAVVTEWRHALAESTSSRKRLDRALDGARLALFELDLASGRVYLTDAWAEMIGAERGETHTTIAELDELSHPDEREMMRKLTGDADWGRTDGYEVERRVRRRDGEWIWVFSRARVVERDASGRALRAAGTVVDITERKKTEQRVHHLATRDALTNLTNRALFGDRVESAIEEAARRSGRVALISVGLDRFTAINDSLGHHVGDQVLRVIADRLLDAGAGITVARAGGDEYLLLLPEIQAPHEAAAFAENTLVTISRPVPIEQRRLVVAASIGIAIYPDDCDSAGLLLRNADTALHHAKEAGGANIQFFAEAMNVAARTRLDLEAAMRLGLERDEFFVHYQPQVDLATGALTGYEALARWQHPSRGLIPPTEFIPIAESTGLIIALGKRVLAIACADAVRWQREGEAPVRVAVNVTARQFRHKGFVASLKNALDAAGLDPCLLELEIIENAIMDHGADTLAALGAISKMGVQLAIDDFGTGYSSLSYLRRLPIDLVKIDQSFVADLPDDPGASAIVGSIIALAHNLGLEVLAEGVETEAQCTYLRQRGCDRGQGYLFGRPQAVELWSVDPETDGSGGRYWDRTSGPSRVRGVLYR